MAVKDKKVPTGFRLSPENMRLLDDLENSLGLNRSSVVNMILTLVRNNRNTMIQLLSTAIRKK